MSAYQLKIAKYYRLSDKSTVETDKVLVLVDTKNRRLSVSCKRIQKENVAIPSEPREYPRLTFRDNHLYVLLSGISADGFRLTFAVKEREEFMNLMHSMGVLMNVPTGFQGRDSQFSMSQESHGSGSVKMESQGSLHSQQYRPASSSSSISSSAHHHRPPAFTQQPTPQVALFPPNVRRDTTDVFNSYSQPPPSDSPSFRHHPYYGNVYEAIDERRYQNQHQNATSYSQRISGGSGRSTGSVHGERMRKKRELEMSQETLKLDKATQTDDLIDALIEDKDFVKKALTEMTKNDQFMSVIKSMRSRLESMDTVERQRLHWKTNPNYNSQGMPPPVIHLPNSDAE